MDCSEGTYNRAACPRGARVGEEAEGIPGGRLGRVGCPHGGDSAPPRPSIAPRKIFQKRQVFARETASKASALKTFVGSEVYLWDGL